MTFESVTELRRQRVRGARQNQGSGQRERRAPSRNMPRSSERYEFLRAQVGDVETRPRAELHTHHRRAFADEMRSACSATSLQADQHATSGRIFAELFGGGHGAAVPGGREPTCWAAASSIEVAPPGKVIQQPVARCPAASRRWWPSPFTSPFSASIPRPSAVLDEIEAALDDVNVARYAQYLRRMTDDTQFIVITHRRGTMEAADVLYGVTMQEDGVSKILRLDLDKVSADLIT